MENIIYNSLKELLRNLTEKGISDLSDVRVDELITSGVGLGLKKGKKNLRKNEVVYSILAYLKEKEINMEMYKYQLEILKYLERYKFSECLEKKIIQNAELMKASEIELVEDEDIYKLRKIINNYNKIDEQYLEKGGSLYNSIRIGEYIKKEKENLNYKRRDEILLKLKEDLRVDLGEDFIQYNFMIKSVNNGVEKYELLILNKIYEREILIKKFIKEKVIEKNRIRDDILESENVDMIAWNSDSIGLTMGQIAALKVINKNNISIITGGPGTGKTTLLSCIYHYYLEKYENVYVVSFTGTSVKRIQDGVIDFINERKKNKVNKVLEEIKLKDNIKTIHSFLATSKLKKLNAEIMIIDEFSMVYESLFYKLIKDQRWNIKKIIIFGDPDQLPSIKKDYLFNNMINLNIIPIYRLSNNMRASNKRDLLEFYSMVLEKKIDYKRFEKSSQVEIIKLEECMKVIESYGKNVKDLLILSPYRTKGDVNIGEINDLCRKFYDETIDVKNKINQYREGNIIIANKNFEYIFMREKKKIYNGTRYEIISMEEIYETPIISKKYCILQEVNTNEMPIKLGIEFLEYFEFGFAMTVHKAQGKESKICIVVLPSYPSYTSDNFETVNILYTAVTRAKEKLIVISSEEIMNRYINNKEKVFKTIISQDQKIENINNEYSLVRDRLSQEKPETYEEVKIEYIYLNVLYSEKDIVKGFGGKWDNDNRRWYVMSNNDKIGEILKRWKGYNVRTREIKNNVGVL